MSGFETPPVEKIFDRETALKEFEAILKSPDGDVLYFLDAVVSAVSSGNEAVQKTLKTNGFDNMDNLWGKIKSYEEKYSLDLGLTTDVTNLRHSFQVGDFLSVGNEARDLAAKIRSLQESGSFIKG